MRQLIRPAQAVAVFVGAAAAIGGAAQAQSFDISFDGGQTFNNDVVFVPGEEYEISVWLRGGVGIANFSGWSAFEFQLQLGGAADLIGFHANSGGVYDEQGAETAPIPNATAVTGWNTAPDTWLAGRRPGGGTAFGGAIQSHGWRFAPGGNGLSSFSAIPLGSGFVVAQDGAGTITGSQGNSSLISPFFSEYANLGASVEIFRFLYTPTTFGFHEIQVDAVGASVFTNGNFDADVDVSNLIGGSSATLFVPSASTGVLLGLAGIATGSRRRR